MLESLLIGLTTSGVYYLAQRHREHLQQTETTKALSENEIQNSLEMGLKSLFPKLSKDFPAMRAIDEDQIKCLQELFYRSDGELEDRLRQTITENLYGLSGFQDATGVDMFSVEGMEHVLFELKDSKNLNSLKPETLSSVVPRIFVRMLYEISTNPELKNLFEQIRECQKARFRQDVVQQLSEIQHYTKLDDKTILSAVNAARHRLKAQATRTYDIKMAGRAPNLNDRFDYMPPGMRRVIKKDNQIPQDFEENTEPIDTDAFHNLFLKKKRVLIIAGAGVGKTTFLYRTQLELMQNRLKDAPLPVFEDVNEFFENTGTLIERVVGLLGKTKSVDYSPEKARRIAGMLNETGRLCFLLDSMDQCSDDRRCKNHFQMDTSGILEQNRVAVACRIEHIKSDPEVFRDIFSAYEWVILGGFSEDQLFVYLGDEITEWLDYKLLGEDFKKLLRVPFYANITRRIGMQPETERGRVENRSQLLFKFEVELFREAKQRGIGISELDVPEIKNLLYQLSLETLTENQIQSFPFRFIDKYRKNYRNACEIIFNAHWVFFNRTLFEGKDENSCTFYHQLLQEYFAACRLKQLFEEDPEAFDSALIKLPFSPVVLDLLDDILEHEPVFKYCMDRFEEALARADHEKKGSEDAGHKFTWLLSLRDRKGEKPGLKERLQEIFDAEKDQSQKYVIADDKFVRIPAGAFLMGGYERDLEQPVRVVYVSDYWISKYAETSREYDEYHIPYSKKPLEDEKWAKGYLPVIDVSWDDVKAYISWKGKAYSLPTEAQWEKAARGRLGRTYPWGNYKPDNSICNYDYNIKKKVEVHKFEPQMYGIYQMAGNVDEWVADCYHDSYEGAPIDGSTWAEDEQGSFRMIRGGSWCNDARNCRSVTRKDFGPDIGDYFIGFRLSRSVTLGH
ncbi:MAG: SUMF1/EgtB/PvdO family nonheme iron enzyme [Proteobacteria bacterium]|nr:SUMF1/EgtB/PvdO family nonheme iron enzyme [Pseudomonadota bacterium]